MSIDAVVVLCFIGSALVLTGVAQSVVWVMMEKRRRVRWYREAFDHDKETPPPWWDAKREAMIAKCDHDDVVARGDSSAPGFLCRKCGAWIDGKRL